MRLDVPVTVLRAGATNVPGEQIAAESEVTLGPGDYTVFPPHAGGEARNDSADPSQVAVAELVPEQLAQSLGGTPIP